MLWSHLVSGKGPEGRGHAGQGQRTPGRGEKASQGQKSGGPDSKRAVQVEDYDVMMEEAGTTALGLAAGIGSATAG